MDNQDKIAALERDYAAQAAGILVLMKQLDAAIARASTAERECERLRGEAKETAHLLTDRREWQQVATRNCEENATLRAECERLRGMIAERDDVIAKLTEQIDRDALARHGADDEKMERIDELSAKLERYEGARDKLMMDEPSNFSSVRAKLERFNSFTPTSKNINALPDSLRQYIADLEARCDPAGEVRELSIARDITRAMEAKLERFEGAVEVHLVRSTECNGGYMINADETLASEYEKLTGRDLSRLRVLIIADEGSMR